MADPTVTQQAIAAQVVLLIKATMAPVLAQMAALEQANKDLTARLLVLSDVRDRVVAMETKAAMPVLVPPVVDVSPLLERVSTVEGRLMAAETKAAIPMTATVVEPVDLTPVVARIAAAEARLDTLGDVRDRVVVMETKAGNPIEIMVPVPVLGRISHLEHVKENHAKDLGAMRERVAALEVRVQIPGPPGKDGQDGKDGQHGHDGTHGQPGKDGADGMGWDDLIVDHDGERTFTIKLVKGERVKDVGTFMVPSVIYRGVYQEGKAYTKGDAVTWAGSLWVVGEDTTTKPGEGSKAYTLAVKKGRDGRDGTDAPGAMPVVSVRPR